MRLRDMQGLDRLLLLMVMAGAVALGTTAHGRLHLARAPLPSPLSAPGLDQVDVVILLSSSCAASQMLDPSWFEDLRSTLKARGAREGVSVAIVGVAVDQSWTRGIDFLRGLGEFDEVRSGRDWLGSGAVEFMYRDLAGPTSIPQVVVVKRQVTMRGNLADLHFGEDRLLSRKVGVDELWAWQDRGFPVFIGEGG